MSGARARQSDQAGCKNAARAEVTLEMRVLLALVLCYVRRALKPSWIFNPCNEHGELRHRWERKRYVNEVASDHHWRVILNECEYCDDHVRKEHGLACVWSYVCLRPAPPIRWPKTVTDFERGIFVPSCFLPRDFQMSPGAQMFVPGRGRHELGAVGVAAGSEPSGGAWRVSMPPGSGGQSSGSALQASITEVDCQMALGALSLCSRPSLALWRCCRLRRGHACQRAPHPRFRMPIKQLCKRSGIDQLPQLVCSKI